MDLLRSFNHTRRSTKILQKKSYDLCPYPVSMSAFSLAWSLLKEDGQSWENAGPYNMHDHHEWEEADPWGYGYGYDGEGRGFYDIFTEALGHEIHGGLPLESWQVRTPEDFEELQMLNEVLMDKSYNPAEQVRFHELDAGHPLNKYFEKLYHKFWPPPPEDSNL